MIRKTLTILSLIGLLLSVSLWGVSYWNIEYGTPELVNFVAAYGGVVMWLHNTHAESRRPVGWHVDGFALKTNLWNRSPWLYKSFSPHIPDAWALVLPLWIPTLAFASSFAFLYYPFHRRRKRKKLGLCLKCGYDLRGSSERCPECGTEFEKQ